MKRLKYGLLSFLVAAAFVFQPAPAGVLAGGTNNASEWANGQVQEAYSLGLVPNELMNRMQDNITRKEFCALAMAFYEAYTGSKGTSLNQSPFYDEQSPFVVRAYELGIITGVNETMFFPDDPLMREQLPVYLGNTMTACSNKFEMQTKNPEAFSDQDLISDEAKEAVAFFTAEKIISGYNGQFYPKSFVTVEQAVIMFLNVYQAYHVEPFTIGKETVKLGTPLAEALSKFGEPKAIYDSEFGFSRYVFHNNYENFIMLGIYNDMVVEIYTNHPGFRYKNFTYGVPLDDVVDLESVAVTDNYANFGNYIEKATVYFDENDNFKTDAIYVRYTDLENPYDSYTEKFTEDTERLLFDFVNSARVARGLIPYEWEEQAAQTAKAHSGDMKAMAAVTYESADGSTAFTRMQEAGLLFLTAGEVVSGTQMETIGVYNEWMRNLGTRANLFSKEMTHAGIGCTMDGFKILTTVDVYQKKDS